jgi:hypothetical protein
MEESEAVNAAFFSPEFFDYIAHELANPLNGMLMSVEIIGKDI